MKTIELDTQEFNILYEAASEYASEKYSYGDLRTEAASGFIAGYKYAKWLAKQE